MSSEDQNPFSKLSPFQLDILAECLEFESAGLEVPMGGGKTRISLVLANETTNSDKHILIVAQSKNLIGSWVDEIHEVFGDRYGIYVYHNDYDKKYLQKRTVTTRFVITTPEMVRKFYVANNLESWLVTKETRNKGVFGEHEVILYSRNPQPVDCSDIIFSTHWGTLIIDEFHLVSKITTLQCRGLLCIPANRKWLLSGTFFSDPDESHILAYYTILNMYPHFPNSLPDTKKYIKGDLKELPPFTGTRNTMVHRDKIPVVIRKVFHEIIVPLRPEEEKIYLALRNIAIELNKEMQEEGADKKKFNSALLSMIPYLRQCITCAVLPVASMSLDVCSHGEIDTISQRFFEIIGEMEIDEYLNDVGSVISSKMERALQISSRHQKVVIFTSYRTTIDLMMSVIEGIECFTLEGDMPGKERDAILKKCKSLDRFILFLTFKIGSSGMNLQFADTVIIMDTEWMEANTSQAIARVARQGQEQEVNIYFLLSNTGIEEAIFRKQINKSEIIDELQNGVVTTSRDKFKVQDIIILLEQEQVSEKMRTLYVH